jgi:hypothetical protein
MLRHVSVVVIVVLILTDAVLAIITGVVARVRGRRFWPWAVLALVVPVVALLVVLLLPGRRRR